MKPYGRREMNETLERADEYARADKYARRFKSSEPVRHRVSAKEFAAGVGCLILYGLGVTAFAIVLNAVLDAF